MKCTNISNGLGGLATDIININNFREYCKHKKYESNAKKIGLCILQVL